MKTLSKTKILPLIVLLAIFATCSDDDNNTLRYQSQELHQNSGPKYFSSSIDKAELAVTLQGTGPFTVYAPTMQHLQLLHQLDTHR
jgi:hypothetical protein